MTLLTSKVDGTDMAGQVTHSARQSQTSLLIEHKRSPGHPFNGDFNLDGRCPESYIAALANLTLRTDILRTDDVICQFSVPTSLDRMVRTLEALNNARQYMHARSIVAPQDEAYRAAGFASAWAGMRHPEPQLTGDT